jgi:pyruvate/2-oxoglutarate dehydrogenase complex dihydrolipoamide acyltransferase (E2) component
MSTVDLVVPADFWTDVEAGTEALVDRWLVAEGDSVTRGQPLANVMLVKANQELVAPAAGVLERILVQAEQTFGRGQPLAVIRKT